MIIEFEDKLDSGRPIWFIASDFTEDLSVGVNLGPDCWQARLEGTDFPVSLSESEEDRLISKATDQYRDWCDSDWDY
jgi:hypothetical protein